MASHSFKSENGLVSIFLNSCVADLTHVCKANCPYIIVFEYYILNEFDDKCTHAGQADLKFHGKRVNVDDERG